MPSKATAQVVVPEAEDFPEATQEEVTLLRGFSDLVGERMGYFVGRRKKQAELNELTKEEREAVTTIRKGITGKNLVKLITDGNIKEYNEIVATLNTAREVVTEKSKPLRAVINPLRKAQNYIDTVCIPNALEQLGKPIQERFSLSKWVKEGMEAEKN